MDTRHSKVPLLRLLFAFRTLGRCDDFTFFAPPALALTLSCNPDRDIPFRLTSTFYLLGLDKSGKSNAVPLIVLADRAARCPR